MRNRVFLFSVLALSLPWQAYAKYARPDLVDVPVDRLVKNLEESAKKDPKNAEIRLNLARAHAMAYALRTDTLQARRGAEDGGPWLGYEPQHVPFRLKASEGNGDKAQIQAARKHLDAALAEYQVAHKLAPDDLTIALGRAWCLEQAGEKEQAIAEYRQIIEAGWKQEKDLKEAGLGWHSVTGEAAAYLAPLLDKQKNSDELKTLADRKLRMQQVSRPVTPIVIPLRAGLNLSDLEDRSASVAFDADGSGIRKRWTWIGKDAGWLVHDRQQTKRIESALQLFGNVSFWMFWKNGYEPLAALDDNADGLLQGPELQGLAIWHDVNGNGISDTGEVKSLAEHGIVALAVSHERNAEGVIFSPAGVCFGDGSKRATYDIILEPRE